MNAETPKDNCKGKKSTGVFIKKEIRIPPNVLKCNHDKTSTKKGRFLCTKIIP